MLSSTLLASALEAAPDAIVIIDELGCILFVNRQMHSLLGYEQRELIGTCIDQLLPARHRDKHPGHRARFTLSGGSIRPMSSNKELFALHRNGTEIPVEISLSPLHDGDYLLVAAAIRDVTEHRQAQNDLMAARLQADRANSAKSRFLSMASHDLRQPVQTLGLLNGSLRRVVHDAEALGAINQQEHAIASMSRLLNALLDISKLESGAIRAELNSFAVTPLFQELCQEFQPTAAAKGLALRWSGRECCVHSDWTLVGQILRNLVSNAIKYTSSGHVELRCVTAGERVLIEVADTGIGIDAEHLGALCDEFYQVGVPANATREGYGLGLSIVKRLVSLLGLELTIRSEPGRGSVFGLELPQARGAVLPAVPTLGVKEPALTPQRNYRILLVEDDQGVRDATRLLLKVEGYKVLVAASRDEALALVDQHGAVDLLITDFHLAPDVSGLDVIQALRQRDPSPFQVIIVTGDTSAAMRELPQDTHLRLLPKPVHADELLALIKELLP